MGLQGHQQYRLLGHGVAHQQQSLCPAAGVARVCRSHAEKPDLLHPLVPAAVGRQPPFESDLIQVTIFHMSSADFTMSLDGGIGPTTFSVPMRL